MIDDTYTYFDKKSVQSCGQTDHVSITTPDTHFAVDGRDFNAKTIYVGTAEVDAIIYLRHSNTQRVVGYPVSSGQYLVGSFDMYTSATTGVTNIIALI